MNEIATNAASYAVEHWGRHLSKRQRATMRQRYFDSALAALLIFHEIQGAQLIRARAYSCEN